MKLNEGIANLIMADAYNLASTAAKKYHYNQVTTERLAIVLAVNIIQQTIELNREKNDCLRNLETQVMTIPIVNVPRGGGKRCSLR